MHIFIYTEFHGPRNFLQAIGGYSHSLTQKESIKKLLCFGFYVGVQLGGAVQVAGGLLYTRPLFFDA